MLKNKVLIYVGVTLFASTSLEKELTGQPLVSSKNGVGIAFGLKSTELGLKEDLALRDQFSKHFRLPDGKMQALVGSGPLHYKDGNGQWQDIDTRTTTSSDASFILENASNLFQSFYPTNILSSSGIALVLKNAKINIGISPKIEIFDAGGCLIKVLETANPSFAKAEGNAVVYDEVFANSSYEFVIGNGQVKNNLVLETQPTLPSNAAFFALTETIVIPSDWSLQTGEKTVQTASLTPKQVNIIDAFGKGVFSIPIPEIFELNDPSETVQANGRFEKAYLVKNKGGGVYELSVLVPTDWLTDQSRTYPVVIDPTITLLGNWGGYMTDGSYLSQGNPYGFVFVAQSYYSEMHRAFINWDISSIPTNAIITNTELKTYLNGTSGSATTETIYVNDVNTPPPYASFSTSVYNDLGDVPYMNFTCSGTGYYGYYDLGPDGDTNVQENVSLGWFTLGFSMPTGTTWKRFTSDLSELRITYQTCASTINVDASATTNSFGYQVDCHGDSTGSINTTATGGGSSYIYVWGDTTGQYVDTIQNPTGLPAGMYVVTVYSGSLCPAMDTVTLTQPENLVISIDSINNYIGGYNISCKNETDGSIDISISGSTGYTYSWDGPNGFSATTQDVSNLSAGTYYVTVTEGNSSCTVTDSFTLTEPLLLFTSIANSQDAYCADDANGSAQASVVGGSPAYSYLWSGTGATTASATGLNANTNYTVTATDANGCTSTANVFIGAQHELPVVELGPADTGYCEGGFLILNAGGGILTYLWNDASTGQVLQVSALGVYSVTVTNAAGCSNSDQINVNQVYSLPTPELGSDIVGDSGSVILDPGEFEDYFWNTNATTQQITVTQSGTYTITVTDEHGCEGVDQIVVTLWPLGTNPLVQPETFNIYPVPANDWITLYAPQLPAGELQIVLTNSLGQQIYQRTVTGSAVLNEQINVGKLSNGVYFARLSGENINWQQSFVVE